MTGAVEVAWAGEPLALDAVQYALLPAVLGEYAIVAREASVCLRVYLP